MKLKIVFLFAIVSLFLGWLNFCQAGLGISPSQWIEEHGLKGSHIEKIFTLSRSDPEQNLYFTAKIEQIEGEIEDWISIDKGFEFVMPKGEQRFPIKVTIDIPQNAEHKRYKAEITLKSESRGETQGQVGIVLSSLIQIDLFVSDKEFLDYEILQIVIPDQEQGEFLDVNLKIWNRGNIEAKPTKLTANFWNKFKWEELGTKEIIDFSGIEAIRSFSEGGIEVKIPMEFEPEQYWANIKVYQDEELLEDEDIFFEILEKKTTKDFIEKEVLGQTISEKVDALKDKINFYYVLVGTLVAILASGIGFGIRWFKKSGLRFKIRLEKNIEKIADEKIKEKEKTKQKRIRKIQKQDKKRIVKILVKGD